MLQYVQLMYGAIYNWRGLSNKCRIFRMSDNQEKSQECEKEKAGVAAAADTKRSHGERDISVDMHPTHKPHARDSTASVASFVELMTIDLVTGDLSSVRYAEKVDLIEAQRVYKKASSNSLLTLYLASRELVSNGSDPAILKGILYCDPKSTQGCRVYAQLTLTFRYGREDEEVMGLRFCNEAIMSLHQIWPRIEEPARESLTPLQDALIRRLGEGALPFSLTLTPQAPPSVQLVPAKKYHGAPIGTSYEVRCFIDKTYEKFNRKATVRMSVRVIHRVDITSHCYVPDYLTNMLTNNKQSLISSDEKKENTETIQSPDNQQFTSSTSSNTNEVSHSNLDESNKKTDHRSDTHTSKIRISPKNFKFCHKFGRSKSEAERGPNIPCLNYSKSFQEYDTCTGPEGEVNKPFLLQEGRVSLHASLDKSWYAHGEDIIVTVNVKNDSRKTVRKIRVCAIQHVDVCMFNNGKFKNIVADSDQIQPSDQIVGPGSSLVSTFILKPQRGTTKNWIALEDSLQRSCEPEEITGCIAASALKTPTMCTSTSPNSKSERNVFAIYVSYYVKVKLTLSGMGGELSLKLPFVLIHVENTSRGSSKTFSRSISQDPTNKPRSESSSDYPGHMLDPSNVGSSHSKDDSFPKDDQDSDDEEERRDSGLEKSESLDRDVQLLENLSIKLASKSRLVRHENVEEFCEEIEEITSLKNAITEVVPEIPNSDKSTEQTIVEIHET